MRPRRISRKWLELICLTLIPIVLYGGTRMHESWKQGEAWNPKQYESRKPVVLGKQECPGLHVFAFSPDSSLLATGGGNYDVKAGDVVKLWDVHSKTSLGPLVGLGHSQVDAAFFSPDGQQLFVLVYTGGDLYPGQHELELWDVETRTLIRTVKGPPYPKLRSVSGSKAISPDGRYVVRIEGQTIIIQRIK